MSGKINQIKYQSVIKMDDVQMRKLMGGSRGSRLSWKITSDEGSFEKQASCPTG